MFAGTILDDAKTLRDYRFPKQNGVISLGGWKESVEEKRRWSSISCKFDGQVALTLLTLLRPSPSL